MEEKPCNYSLSVKFTFCWGNAAIMYTCLSVVSKKENVGKNI